MGQGSEVQGFQHETSQKKGEGFVPPWKEVSFVRKCFLWLKNQAYWLILVGLALGATGLWQTIQNATELQAHVLPLHHSLGSPWPGRIQELLVTNGQQVKKGQLLLALDDKELSVLISIAKTKLSRIQSEIASKKITLGWERASHANRIQRWYHQSRQERLALQGKLKRWKAELAAVNQELRRLRKLQKNRLARTPRLGMLLAQQKSLEQRIRFAPRELRSLHRHHAQARQYKSGLSLPGKGSAQMVAILLKPLLLQEKEQKLHLQQLELRKSRLKLFSPVNGTVRGIQLQKHSIFPANQVLLQVIQQHSNRIVLFLHERFAKQVRVGMKALVFAKSESADTFWGLFPKKKKYLGQISGLGTITTLPQQYQQIVNRSTLVRPVYIKINDASGLLPGETVHVSFYRK